jgi:hypothetical protein
VFSHSAESSNQLTSDWSRSILDTTQLRRTKSVVTFEMSLVIGTHDSGRKKRLPKPADAQDPEAQAQLEWQEPSWVESGYPEGGYDGPYYDELGYPYYDGYDYSSDPNYYPEYPTPAPDLIPPPEPQEEVDEKTRIRRQEQLLLPSEPPQEGESSSSNTPYVPTAPIIPTDSFADHIQPDGSMASSTLHSAASVASATSAETIRPHSVSPPPAPPAAGEARTTDDKHELERQRLLAQASAPPLDDEAATSSSPVAPPALTPSAPTINEEDEYNVQTLHHDHMGPDTLPQYQR